MYMYIHFVMFKYKYPCVHVHVISDFKITVIEYISYLCTLNTLHLCIVHCTLYVYVYYTYM